MEMSKAELTGIEIVNTFEKFEVQHDVFVRGNSGFRIAGKNARAATKKLADLCWRYQVESMDECFGRN